MWEFQQVIARAIIEVLDVANTERNLSYYIDMEGVHLCTTNFSQFVARLTVHIICSTVTVTVCNADRHEVKFCVADPEYLSKIVALVMPDGEDY